MAKKPIHLRVARERVHNAQGARRPKYGGGGPNPDQRGERRSEALTRNAAWAALSIEQKLASLDDRLGPGQGAEKQRARLQLALDARRAQEEAAAQSAAQEIEAKKAKAVKNQKYQEKKSKKNTPRS